MRIDAIRAEIDRLPLDAVERGLLLTSLLEAADRVDSTVGVQMAYLKRWAPRASNPLQLREPTAVPGPAGTPRMGDANQLAAELRRRRSGLPRPALQPAQLRRELPRVGDDRPKRRTRPLRRRLQAARRARASQPLQLEDAGVGRARRPGVQPDDTLADGVVLERGVPRAGRRAGTAGAAAPRGRRRDRRAPLRGRAHRHPQPLRRAGRTRLAPAQHRGSCSCAGRTARPSRSAWRACCPWPCRSRPGNRPPRSPV